MQSDEAEVGNPASFPDGDPAGLPPHDFGMTGSWLNGGRAASFKKSLFEMARMTEEALELWTGKVSVAGSGLSTVSLPDLADQPLHYIELFFDESGQSAFMIFDLEIALSIVTLMLGGNGDPGPVRDLTPLEARLLADLVDAMIPKFATELHLGPARFKAHHAHQSTMRDGLSETLLCFGLDLTGPQVSGTAMVGISPLSLQGHMEIIDRRLNGRPRNAESITTSAAAAALQPVIVPVIVGFAAIRAPAYDIANLAPGDLIRTGQSLGRHLVASVGNVPVFTVKAGQRGGRLVAEVLTTPQHDFAATAPISKDPQT